MFAPSELIFFSRRLSINRDCRLGRREHRLPHLSEGTNPPLPAGESLDSAILQMLMETLPDRIYFKDRHSRFVRNNLAHARSLGAASPADVVGKSDADFFSREHAERAFADEQVII